MLERVLLGEVAEENRPSLRKMAEELSQLSRVIQQRLRGADAMALDNPQLGIMRLILCTR